MSAVTVTPPVNTGNSRDVYPRDVVIDTNILISEPLDQCNQILSKAKTYINKNSFLSDLKLSSSPPNLINNLTSFKNKLTQTNAGNNNAFYFDQNSSFSDTEANKSAIDYLNRIKNNTIPKLTNVKNCLVEEGSYDANFDLLQKQKRRTEESRLRLQRIQNPEEDVSYYEGWFPLFRPMTETMIFTLFGTGLFLLLLGLAIFLKMGGISIEFQMAGGGGGGFGDPASFFASNKAIIIGGAALGVGVGIGFIGGWFGRKQE